MTKQKRFPLRVVDQPLQATGYINLIKRVYKIMICGEARIEEMREEIEWLKARIEEMEKDK